MLLKILILLHPIASLTEAIGFIHSPIRMWHANTSLYEWFIRLRYVGLNNAAAFHTFCTILA